MLRSALLGGLLFAFAVVVGGQVYRENTLVGLFRPTPELAESLGGLAGPVAALGTIALFAIVALAAAAVLLVLMRAPAALARRQLKPAPAFLATRGGFALMWAVLFALFVPCLLAYWPGPFSYDIPTQTAYVATGRWTTQQPPLHTLLWAAFLHMEGVLGLRAITWYDLFQMLFLSGSFAHVLRFLASRGTNRVLFALAFAFFGLNPVVALFAITPVKDALLAGILCLMGVGVTRMAAQPREFMKSPPACAGLATCVLVICLLRTNFMAAIFVFAVAAVIALRGVRRQTALLFGAPILAAAIVMGPGYAALGITPGSSAVASLPFQQVVNVVRNHADELPAEELAVVEAVLPVDQAVEAYNPRFADTVVRLFKGKQSGARAMAGQLVALGGQWAAWSVRYPIDYLDAFLALNIPYWYPFASTPDPFSQRAYIETDVWKESEHYPWQLESKAPALHDAYEQVASYRALANPVAGTVFSPSSVAWITLTSFLLLYNAHRRRFGLLALLPLLMGASFLIGPVSNMRYVFPLFCLHPLLACAALQPALLFDVGKAGLAGRGTTVAPPAPASPEHPDAKGARP